MRETDASGGLVACGVVLTVTQATAAWLGRSFVFGVGHETRPILSFLGVEALAFVVYVAAVEIVRQAPPRRWHVAWVLAVGLACRALWWPAPLIQEVDPYRYVWDGQAVLQGANPYERAPAEARARGRPPAVALNRAGEAVYERINYPEVPTVYPPAAQALFAVAQIPTPWALGGWKGLLLLAEAASSVLLMLVLRRLGRSLAWVVVYAWSPLVLKEFSNGLHLDAFAVLGLCGWLLATIRDRPVAGAAALAWTTLVKIFGIALLPLLAVRQWRRGPRAMASVVLVFAVTVGLAYLPWLDRDLQAFDGLVAFARHWQRNDSLYTVATWFAGSRARLICGVALAACVAAATGWVARVPSAARVSAASLFVIVAIFLLSPTSNPWYLTWAVPFLVVFPSRALLLLSGTVLLYYADFHFLYRGQEAWRDVVRLVEYVPFYVALAVELWQVRRRRARFDAL